MVQGSEGVLTMSEAAKQAQTAAANTNILDVLNIDPALGGATSVVSGFLAEAADGSAINEGEYNDNAYASCVVDYMGGSVKISLRPSSEDHRIIGKARPGQRVIFAIETKQKQVKIGNYDKPVFIPEGKAKLLFMEPS